MAILISDHGGQRTLDLISVLAGQVSGADLWGLFFTAGQARLRGGGYGRGDRRGRGRVRNRRQSLDHPRILDEPVRHCHVVGWLSRM
jgi:hypothetical protein